MFPWISWSIFAERWSTVFLYLPANALEVTNMCFSPQQPVHGIIHKEGLLLVDSLLFSLKSSSVANSQAGFWLSPQWCVQSAYSKEGLASCSLYLCSAECDDSWEKAGS